MQEHSLSPLIAQYIKAREEARLEKFDKEAEKERKKAAASESVEMDAELAQARDELQTKFHPPIWLSDAAARAKQISMVTHALKFTHTDAKGSSVLAAGNGESDQPYLCTADLPHPVVDVVGNAAALDVAGLLKLSDGKQSLVDLIAEKDGTALKLFAEDESQLQVWMDGFSAALADKELSSHKLAKQLYFPLGDGGYHLLSPLFSSSLSHALHQRIAESRFSDESKDIRKAKREEKYHSGIAVDYPRTAVQTFGGTKPQNVSQLNSQRRGSTWLLNCAPPTWTSEEVSEPQSVFSFWRLYSRQTRNQFWAFRRHLEANKAQDRANNEALRNRWKEYVNELIDELLQLAAQIQTLEPGWSEVSNIPQAEKFWLDPLRDDEAFRQARENSDWHEAIAEQFARWLNGRLERAKLQVSEETFVEWKAMVLEEFTQLRLHGEVNS